jgi:hypothetical protein
VTGTELSDEQETPELASQVGDTTAHNGTYRAASAAANFDPLYPA